MDYTIKKVKKAEKAEKIQKLKNSTRQLIRYFMASRIKMSDIAEKIGVSTVTISKALTGKDGVSGELRQTIKQKAAEMGYVYNSLPRNMLQGRTYNIGVLIADRYLGYSSFYWIFYKSLLQAFKKTNYLGILEIVGDKDEIDCVAPEFFDQQRVDGLILLGQFSDSYLAAITSKTRRCVFLDFYSDIGACDCVASNNFLGSYNLTKLLIGAGHTKIAFIGSTSATTSILDRYMGFCKAMLEVGLVYEAAIEDRDKNGRYIPLSLNAGCYTAYVCNSDQLAGNVIRDLQKSGLRVPEDISLVGFDNESETVTAGLSVTSLEVNTASMCESALTFLIQHIENEAYVPHGRSFIDGTVVVKHSIAPPREGCKQAGVVATGLCHFSPFTALT
jgi:LacI family transcriptional regulator